MATAQQLVKEMGLDNGCVFTPTKLQMSQLENAVIACAKEGLEFTDENIEEITSGEVSEVEEKFSKYPSYPGLSKILGEIFNGEAEPY